MRPASPSVGLRWNQNWNQKQIEVRQGPLAPIAQLSCPRRYTPPRAWHSCSAACWFALDRVQVPTEYVPPADVQIAWPDEQAATQSKMAIATGTGLILHIRGLSCWPFGCDIRTPRSALIRIAPCSWGPGPLHNARNLCGARACPEGDCSSQGHYPPSGGTSRPGMTAAMSRNSRDKLCFTLPFLASLIYPGHGQVIPLLIRLLLGVESPVDRRG